MPHYFLYFAHRGEAQAFLKEWRLESVREGVYTGEAQGKRITLLIGGEGVTETLANLSYELGKTEGITHLFNLGICGHIKRPGEEFNIGDVISIRQTIFEDTGIQFKAFTGEKASLNLPYTDIISTTKRILSGDDHKNLVNFASLIDREAWAVGFVANKHSLPFSCLKVISDFADGEICQKVKEDAEVWSDTLFRNFSILLQERKENEDDDASASIKELLPDFHITVSQERSLKNLLHSLELKGHTLSQIKSSPLYQDITALDIHGKKKTKQFIEELQALLNPLEKKLKLDLDEQTQYLQKAGFNVRFDQGYEKEILHLNVSIQNETELKRAARALEQYNFQSYVDLLNQKGDSLV